MKRIICASFTDENTLHHPVIYEYSHNVILYTNIKEVHIKDGATRKGQPRFHRTDSGLVISRR